MLIVYNKVNKTGLQPASRPVEQVPILRGLGVGVNAKQTDRQDWRRYNFWERLNILREKTRKFNDCFLSKTSLVKKFKKFLGVETGGGGRD